MQVIYALWLRNIKIFLRNRIQLVFTIIMPFFFLYVFNSIFSNEYIDNAVNYMLAGIVIANVFQTALTLASSTITDIVSGFMKEILVSPVKRLQVALGQLLSAATISTAQGIIILIIGYFIGLTFTSWLTPIWVILIMAVIGFAFSGFGLLLASLVKNAQAFQVVEVAIAMPLTFLCGAYVPLSILPDALRYFAYANPMTYATAFFRTVILEKMGSTSEQLVNEALAFKFGEFIVTPWISFFIVLGFGLVFLLLATYIFSKVDFSTINRTKLSDADIWA